MSNDKSYMGSCFCGDVKFRVSGESVANGYCHCTSCRKWSASPVNAFTLWKPDALEVLEGENNLEEYHKTTNSYRKWCRTCGGHLFTGHPNFDLVDVYAALIPDYPFKPELHIHYQEAVMNIKDGLPKMKDLPKEMGGSGEVLPE